MAQFEVLGISDEVTACDCCGKSNLKRTVCIHDNESGETKYFGTTCAVAPVKGFGVEKEVKVAIDKADRLSKAINYMAHVEYKKQGGKNGPCNEKGVFPMLDRPLYDRIKAAIKAAPVNFNY